jgi:hypothetical protein
MLTDSNLDCRLTDNLNMNQGSKFQAFSLKNVQVDPLLGATLKRSFPLPDLDQPATFLLHQCCIHFPYLSPVSSLRYLQHKIRCMRMCTRYETFSCAQ